jgi:hypothetical protein
MKTIVAVAMFLISGFATAGWAQDRASDALYLSGRADQMAEAAGAEASVEWLRTVGPSGLRAGGTGGSIAKNWWISGRFGGHRKWRAVTASGTVDFGRAGDIASGSNYGGLKGGIAMPLTSRVLVDVQAQHHSLPGGAAERMYQSSVSWYVRPSLSLQAGYYRLSVPHGGADLVSWRLDITAGGIDWLAGAVVGPPRQSNPLAVQLGMSPSSREFFGGGKFRVGGYDLSTVFTVTQTVVRVARVVVGIRIPLR